MRYRSLLPFLTIAAAITPALGAEVARTVLAPPSSPASAARVAEVHRLLPLGTTEARLRGEIDTRVVPLYLLPTEVARPAKLRVAYSTAISAVPEASRLVATVNDVVVGERSLRASARPETVTFDVPPGLLEAGYNAVRLSVRHAHRVDCSLAASYELWTQILPENSGLIFSGSRPEIRELRELAAVRPTASGTTRIRARASGGIDPATLEHLSRAVQAVVLAGRISKPQIELEPEPSAAPGIDVIVAMEPGASTENGSLADRGGPKVRIQHDQQLDRIVVSVTGGTPNELEAALSTLESTAAASAQPTGSPAGLRGLGASHGVKLTGGETVSLSSLGFATQRFSGRYYRQSGFLQMPEDFYPGHYGRVTLRLDASYAADLAPTSKINVRVNGSIVSTIQLLKKSGDILSRKVIPLPLNVFKAGLNSLDIEAETTMASDSECSAASQTQTRDRLLVSSASELEVPSLARIATFPNLSGIPAGALSSLSDTGRLNVYLPNPSVESIEAAFTLIAKTTFVSGRIAPVAFSFERPDEEAAHVLAIGALSDMPASTLAAAGLDIETLQNAWHPGQPKEPEQEQAMAGPVRIAAAGDFVVSTSSAASSIERRPAIAPANADGAGGVTAPNATEDLSEPSLLAGQGGIIARIADELPALLSSLRDVVKSGEATLGLAADDDRSNDVVSPTSRLVIAQGAGPRSGLTTWQASLLPDVTSATVFVAPNAEMLRTSMEELLSSGLFQQLSGNISSYESGEAGIRSHAAQARWFVPTQALMPSNVRLIMAGWLSQNMIVYVSALAGLTLLLTAFSYRLIRRSGVPE
jgi:hypothetical protein